MEKFVASQEVLYSKYGIRGVWILANSVSASMSACGPQMFKYCFTSTLMAIKFLDVNYFFASLARSLLVAVMSSPTEILEKNDIKGRHDPNSESTTGETTSNPVDSDLEKGGPVDTHEFHGAPEENVLGQDPLLVPPGPPPPTLSKFQTTN